MVRGIESFREWFREYEEQYTIVFGIEPTEYVDRLRQMRGSLLILKRGISVFSCSQECVVRAKPCS